ncbi:hypothetical protein ANTPLA_LOCUS10095 [Anthophora plagiata]
MFFFFQVIFVSGAFFYIYFLFSSLSDQRKQCQTSRLNNKMNKDEDPAGGEARITSRDWENRKQNRWTTTAGVPESNDVTVKSSEGLQVQNG